MRRRDPAKRRDSRRADNSHRPPSQPVALFLASRTIFKVAGRNSKTRAGKSGEFPEQCVVSIRVSVGVAMRWTLVQLGELGSKREDGMRVRGSGDRVAERGLECRQATLHLLLLLLFLFATNVLFLRPLSLSLSPRPLLLLQIYKLSHSRDRTHGRIEPPHGKFDGIGRLIPLQRDVDFHSLRR